MSITDRIAEQINAQLPQSYRMPVTDHRGDVIGYRHVDTTPPRAVVSAKGGRRRDRRAAARRR